jgi:hypothetical protein
MLEWLEENIHLSNINEVCVVLIVTVFSIGFPIFYQAKEKIADNYKSQALLKFFNKNKYFSSFIKVLVLSLFSLIPWVLDVKPLFGMNNFIINNSAKLLIIIFAILLVVKLFMLIKKFTIFSNSNDLLNYLKKEYYKEDEKSYFQKKLEFIISKFS